MLHVKSLCLFLGRDEEHVIEQDRLEIRLIGEQAEAPEEPEQELAAEGAEAETEEA